MASSFKVPSWVVGILATLLGPLLDAVTPQLKGSLTEFVRGLWEKAVETASPFDDMFVRFLAALLNVDLE